MSNLWPATWVRYSQHHHGKHALERVREPVQLTGHRCRALGRRLEGVCHRARNAHNRKQREADLGAPHQVAEEVDVEGGPPRPVELSKQEEGAQTLNYSDGCEITNMEQVDNS